MIIGIFLGIALAVFIGSSIFLIADITRSFQENILTGAVVGSKGIASYFLVSAIVSLIVIVFLAFLLKKEYRDMLSTAFS